MIKGTGHGWGLGEFGWEAKDFQPVLHIGGFLNSKLFVLRKAQNQVG